MSLSVRPSIVQMENITREEGKDAVFECLGEGVPKPTMSIRRESSNEKMIDNPVLYFQNSWMSFFTFVNTGIVCLFFLWTFVQFFSKKIVNHKRAIYIYWLLFQFNFSKIVPILNIQRIDLLKYVHNCQLSYTLKKIKPEVFLIVCCFYEAHFKSTWFF